MKKKEQKNKDSIILSNLSLIVITSLIAIALSFGVGYAATIIFAGNEVSYDNTTSGLDSTTVQDALDELYQTVSDAFVDQMYPVGSIYMSTNLSTPAAVHDEIGGTWEAYGAGRKLVGAGTGTDANSTSQTFTVSSPTGGEYTHTLAVTNLPSHTHNMEHTHGIPALSGTCTAAGSHNHALASLSCGGGGAHSHTATGSCGYPGNHQHTIGTPMRHTTASPEHSGGFNGGGLWAGTKWVLRGDANSTSSGAHTHSVSLNSGSNGAHTHTFSGNSGSVGNHTHSISIAASTTLIGASSAANTGATGSGTAISVQDPYVVVYMYRRTS